MRTPEERQEIVDQVRHYIQLFEIENYLEIKKLNIMLNLFLDVGYEFDRFMPIKELERNLEVKLYADETKKCSIMLKKIRC